MSEQYSFCVWRNKWFQHDLTQDSVFTWTGTQQSSLTAGSPTNLHEFLFLLSLKLRRLAFNRPDEQRQTGVHRFVGGGLDRRGVRVLFLFPGGRLPPWGRDLPPLSSALLLGQDALRGFSVLVAGVGRVQVEQVGGEHGLETRVCDIHLDTQTGGGSLQNGSLLSVGVSTRYHLVTYDH